MTDRLCTWPWGPLKLGLAFAEYPRSCRGSYRRPPSPTVARPIPLVTKYQTASIDGGLGYESQRRTNMGIWAHERFTNRLNYELPVTGWAGETPQIVVALVTQHSTVHGGLQDSQHLAWACYCQ